MFNNPIKNRFGRIILLCYNYLYLYIKDNEIMVLLEDINPIVKRQKMDRNPKEAPHVCISLNNQGDMGNSMWFREIFMPAMKNSGARFSKFSRQWVWIVNSVDEIDTVLENFKSVLYMLADNSVRYKQRALSEESINSIITELRPRLIMELENEENETEFNPDAKAEMAGERFGDINDEKVQEYNRLKDTLNQSLNDPRFQEDIDKILEIYKNSYEHGYKISFLNAAYIHYQMPNATLVKPESAWKALNREIIPEEKNNPLYIVVPTDDYLHGDAYGREMARQDKLRNMGVTDDTASSSQLEIARTQSKFRVGNNASLKAKPVYFDVSQTRVMPGMIDKLENETDAEAAIGKFTEKPNESEETIYYSKIIAKIIEEELHTNPIVNVSDENRDNLNSDAMRKLIAQYTAQKITLYRERKNIHSGNPRADAEMIRMQASLCAWMVLKTLGYDIDTTLMFAKLQGLNTENSANVLDSVAFYCDDLIKKISEKSRPVLSRNRANINLRQRRGAISESIYKKLSSLPIITGEMIAEAIGYGNMYRQTTQNTLNEVKNTFYNILNKI